jgi:hypothetical protein
LAVYEAASCTMPIYLFFTFEMPENRYRELT